MVLVGVSPARGGWREAIFALASVSATPSSHSLLAEQFLVTVAALILDNVEPSLMPGFCALFDYLQERGSHHWATGYPDPRAVADPRHAPLLRSPVVMLFYADVPCRFLMSELLGTHGRLC